MLKGTNRQVIEITQTDCEYFERVMFFVKPECVNVSNGRLRERANLIAGADNKPPATKRRRSRALFVAQLVAAAGAGAGITAAIAAAIA